MHTRKVRLNGHEGKSIVVAVAKQLNLISHGHKCLQKKQSPLSFILVVIGVDIMVRARVLFSTELWIDAINEWEFRFRQRYVHYVGPKETGAFRIPNGILPLLLGLPGNTEPMEELRWLHTREHHPGLKAFFHTIA